MAVIIFHSPGQSRNTLSTNVRPDGRKTAPTTVRANLSLFTDDGIRPTPVTALIALIAAVMRLIK